LLVYYFDEAGFSLQPVVPYGWLKPDSAVTLSSGSHHRRLNVLGMMQCNGEFDSYVFEGSVDSEVVIACIDAFINRLRRRGETLPVVLVLDNAAIHDGPDFQEHVLQWQHQGLTLKYLPPYSPELNMIEILWKRIKYQWLPLDATETWDTLVAAVEDILKNIGSKYQLTFT
jgi:transposase